MPQPNRVYKFGPNPAEVVSLRLRVQDHYGCNIGAARLKCANTTRSSLRAWEQWETGKRRMHPGLWELAQLRCGSHEQLVLAARTGRAS